MNASLRDALPYLRPRSAEPTLFTQTVFILLCIGLIALLSLYFYRSYRQRQRRRQHFYKEAGEAQLSQAQTHFLLQLAQQRKMPNPLLLLTSIYVFDRHIGALAAQLTEADPDDRRLRNIARIRTLLGFDHMPQDQTLRTTRQLEVGQTLMVWPAESDSEGHSPWLVVGRDERGFAMVPLLQEDRRHFDELKRDDELAVRFWRDGDTEYNFIAQVLTVNPEDGTAFIRHAHDVERMQLRDFFRLDIRFNIDLIAIPAEGDEQAEEKEENAEQLGENTGGDADMEEIISLLDEEDENTPHPGEASAHAISAEVLNLSGGGISLLTRQTIPPDHLLQIDPQFKGAFPLAGLLCRIVQRSQHGEGTHLQCQFQDLPMAQESELVRHIYQHQVFATTGEAIELPQGPQVPGMQTDSTGSHS